MLWKFRRYKLNIFSFFIDKIIAILIAIIIALTVTIIYQKWQINSQKSSYSLKIERLERHAEKLKSDYTHMLDEQNTVALEKQNHLLESARVKEQKITTALQQSQLETKAHEKRIKNLSNQLSTSNVSLHKLTQKASRLAKASFNRVKECLPKDSAATRDRQRFTGKGLPERFIDASEEVANEAREFATNPVNDYARLQGQCRKLKEWSQIVQQD